MSEETCYFHSQTQAAAICTDCKKPVCELCLKTVNAEPYCEACAANHYEQSPMLAFLFAFFVLAWVKFTMVIGKKGWSSS